jgi:NADPH:quinone reductase-like Zn-dependent oxidoreductase
MKAIVYTEYGPPDVLKIEDIDKPTPKDDEALVKVHASSVNPAEWYAMTGLFLARLGNGIFKPKNTRLGVIMPGTSRGKT